MVKQSSIMGYYTVPKPKPAETPKRKREEKNKERLGKEKAASPSQESPEHKAVRKEPPKVAIHDKKTPVSKVTPTIRQLKEEIKQKNRGRISQTPVKDTSQGTESSSSKEQPWTQKQVEKHNESVPPTDGTAPADGDLHDTDSIHTIKVQGKVHIEEEVTEGNQKENHEKDVQTPTEKNKKEVRALSNEVEPKVLDKSNEKEVSIEQLKTDTHFGNKETSKASESMTNQINMDTKAPAQSMKGLTFAAKLLKNLTPILPQWKAYRVNISFQIKMPKNKAKRTEYLSRGLNKFLVAAKKVSPNNRTIYVRRFKDHEVLSDTEKMYWIDSFGSTQMTHLMNYTHGFYANQALRDGTFRLTLQLVVPVTTDIPSFIDNVNGIWSESTNQLIRDCKEQSLYNPKQIGWLLRSNWNMGSSNELQDELDRLGIQKYPGLRFGLQWKTIPSPGPKPAKYDRDSAIRAIVVSTNSEHQLQAWDIMFKLYNQEKSPPLGIEMHFVPTKDHPDIRNNPVAVQNITLLMDRQRIFSNDTLTDQCYALADPDREVEQGITLRNKLLSLKCRTMGEEKKGAKLFHAITSRVKDGSVAYFITFHKALEKEASSIISGMGAFLKAEFQVDPDLYCYPIHINPDHEWIAESRTIRNSTVDFLSTLVADMVALQPDLPAEGIEEDDEDYEMTSKGEREFKRTAGLDDSETIANLNQRKSAPGPKRIPQQIESDDKSTKSEMSGLTNYSSASKMSQHRKELRQTVDDQRLMLEEQAAMMALMRKEMEAMKRPSQGSQEADIHRQPLSTQIKVGNPKRNEKDAPTISKQSKSKEANKRSNNQEEEILTQMEEAPPDTFVDADGMTWEYGNDIPMDNPEGEHREIDCSWFQVTQGDEGAARAYAKKLEREGHTIVLSRTGATSSDKYVVYVVVSDDDIQENGEQGSGQETGDNEDHSKYAEGTQSVKFNTTTEVQEFDPESMSLEGENEVKEMKSSANKDHRSVESDESLQSNSSSISKDSIQESSQSSSSSSSSSDKGSKEPQKVEQTSARVEKFQKKTRQTNMTKDMVSETAKMMKKTTEKRAAPKGKQKVTTGGLPGQKD